MSVKVEAARKYLLEAHVAGETPSLKRACRDLNDKGVSIGQITIRRVRDDLIREGLLPTPKNTPRKILAARYLRELPTSPPDSQSTVPPTTDDIRTDAFDPNASLTLDDRLTILRGYARDTKRSELSLKAIQEINRIEERLGKDALVGPPPPLTDKEIVWETSMILNAVGRDLATDAWRSAFDEDAP